MSNWVPLTKTIISSLIYTKQCNAGLSGWWIKFPLNLVVIANDKNKRFPGFLKKTMMSHFTSKTIMQTKKYNKTSVFNLLLKTSACTS